MCFTEITKYNDELFVEVNDCTYLLSGNFGSLLGDVLKDDMHLKSKSKLEFNNIINVNDNGEEYKFYCLIHDKQIVAKACVFFNTIDGFAVKNESIYITALGVYEPFRHQGYGTIFMNSLQEYFQGYKILLGVEPDNEIAYNFYNKLGYHRIATNLFDSDYNIYFDLLEKKV